jgi:hypothetical protein
VIAPWLGRAVTSLEDVVVGARLLWRLPSFLDHSVAPAHARAVLAGWLARREPDFLALVKRSVFEDPGSPYRPLLGWAGCQYGDVERLVEREGVEGTLRALFRAGIYLTADELKGRRPVVRGGASFTVNPDQLRNRALTTHLSGQSTGTGGPRTPVRIDLAHVWDQVIDLRLFIEARGDAASVHAVWGVPGGWATSLLLRLSGCGLLPARWFTQIDLAAEGLHPRYRWSARALVWGSRMVGVPLPVPRHVPIEAPLPIARWMVETLGTGRIPHLWTYASSATRVCQAAAKAGLDIRGARFSVSGEPVTPARLTAVRETGAEIVPRYGASDCGQIGFGCLDPEFPDEVHWLSDLHALIQPPEDGSIPGLPRRLLFMTSLRPTARNILLNASLGDQGTITDRTCGCPFEEEGWRVHVHSIRSDEKVTAAGMKFSDAELIRVLEDVLPARFGGAATHYQLVEEETPGGQSRLRLLVHPVVGPLDLDRVAEEFLGAISRGSGVERVMGLVWREADVLRVERRAPMSTATGKILHLHRASSRAESTLSTG